MKIEIKSGLKFIKKAQKGFKIDWRVPKFAFQRVKDGYDESMFWNFNYNTAQLYLANAVIQLNHLEESGTHPIGFTKAKWRSTLKKIIAGSQEYIEATRQCKEPGKKWATAKQLMADNLDVMWW